MRTFLTGLLIAALAILIVTPSAPAKSDVEGVKKQLQTAMFHSGELAQRGAALAATQTHLQHTINCMEGPRGANFKAAPGYPCQGMGNGVIPDLEAAAAEGVKGADKSLRYAKVAWNLIVTGLKSTSVDEAQPYAKVVAAQLKLALDALQ